MPSSPQHTTEGTQWFKSSYSEGDNGQCVEVAHTADAVHVRDSKNPDGPALAFTAAEFTAFVRFASGLDV